MKDRRLNANGEIEEWERSPTIPDDFIYDPELHAYHAPGEPSYFDVEAIRREIAQIREERLRRPPPPEGEPRPRFVIDLSPPPRKPRRKTNPQQRDLFADLPGDDEPTPSED